MIHPLVNYQDILKEKALKDANIKGISPSDCYKLSLLIEKKTSKRISETTLKRLYGFAASCYNPSIYTLNCIAEFCDYNSWTDFLTQEEKKRLSNWERENWGFILDIAHKITRDNLNKNKLRSGISFPFTINRAAITKKIVQFDKSNYTSLIITSPAGGGKTIALTHWLNERIERKEIENNMYLFINSTAVLSPSKSILSGKEWISSVLKLDPTTLHRYFNAQKKDAPGKFYLVIDDVESHLDCDLLFNQLIELSNCFRKFNWFKLIFSLREDRYVQHQELIELNSTISNQWSTDKRELTSFSTNEIKKLTTLLTGKDFLKVDSNNFNPFIQVPINFQLYYQLKGNKINPNLFTIGDKFLITGKFINQYIFKGENQYEKSILLNKLARYFSSKEGVICLPIHKAESLRKQFESAYKELLSSGVLYKHSDESLINRHTELRFKHTVIGTYFLARRMFLTSKNTFDKTSISRLNRSYYNQETKTELLYWLITFSIEKASFDFLDLLNDIHFEGHSTVNMKIFIVQSIKNLIEHSINGKEIKNCLNKKLPKSSFFNNSLTVFSVNPDYIKALEYFLEYEISKKQRILIHTTLSLLFLFKLDCKRFDFHLSRLKQIPPKSYEVFPLNPYTQLKALFIYFKTGEVSKKALSEITKYNFNCNAPQTCHEVIHFLTILTCYLSLGSRKTLRFLQQSQKASFINNTVFSKEHNEIIQIIKAKETVRLGAFKRPSTSFLTPVTDASNLFVQIAYTIYVMESNFLFRKDISIYVNGILIRIQNNNLKLIELYIRSLYLNSFTYSLNNECKTVIDMHSKSIEQMLQENTSFEREIFEQWSKRATSKRL